jgi:dTDP-glucose 4,6-dehydratase
MENKLSDDLNHILKHTSSLWEDKRKKTIFLTGGTGFFGKWLTESFSYINDKFSLDSKLIILSREPEMFLQLNPQFKRTDIVFIKGDITSFNFPEEKIDYIIHTATAASVSMNIEQPLVMFDTIVDGTRRVLELAKNKNVESFLLTSSGAIYGKQPSNVECMDEDFNSSPNIFNDDAAYGEGKRVAEMLCSFYHKNFGINTKIARCYAFVGPYLPLNTNFAIGNFINDILNKRNISISGNGTPFRSYLYASDLMIWLWTILFHGKPVRPYNVGSNENYTIEELAYKVVSHASNKTEVIINGIKDGKPPMRYTPSILRAQKELNLNVWINLDNSIKKTLEFYL